MNFLKQQQEERERQDQQWIVFIRQQLDAAKYEAADLDVVEDQEQRDARIDALVGRLVKIAAVACSYYERLEVSGSTPSAEKE